MLQDEFVWYEKYRPSTVKDVVLPERLKSLFQSYVDDGGVPNLILSGGHGVGKTTVAIAMLEELGCEWIKLNGSLEGRSIDVLRGKVTEFASSVSFEGGRKYVIFDEADYSNSQTVQPALRGFIEDFADNCGFIFTCNYKSKLIPAVANSRLSHIEFKFTKDEVKKMVPEFYKTAVKILKAEKVPFDKVVLGTLIAKLAPDWRKIIGILQTYAPSKQIDSGILVSLKEVSLDELIKLLKEKDFNAVRKWVSENADSDSTELYTAFFKHAQTYLKDKTSIAKLVLLLSKYQYQSAFAANQEINTMAFMVEAMMECNWK